jgi:hypothetical protein
MFPEARRGQQITAALWNQARAACLAARLLPGPGIRLHYTPDGTIISADASAALWDHPFRVSITGTTATIRSGWVNGSVEPRIDDIPLSGTADSPPPRLTFSEPDTDSEGRGYIALEAQFNETWAVSAVSVIQCARIDALDTTEPATATSAGGVPLLEGRRARWPLAVLRHRESGLNIWQVTHGDLQVRAQPRTATSDGGRAFWW